MAAILHQRRSASKHAGHCQNYAPLMRSVSSHEGTCRCNISLGHAPATFSCVCKCCDFVPGTCPRYTSLLHAASVCTTHVFAAATCPCNIRTSSFIVEDEGIGHVSLCSPFVSSSTMFINVVKVQLFSRS